MIYFGFPGLHVLTDGRMGSEPWLPGFLCLPSCGSRRACRGVSRQLQESHCHCWCGASPCQRLQLCPHPPSPTDGPGCSQRSYAQVTFLRRKAGSHVQWEGTRLWVPKVHQLPARLGGGSQTPAASASPEGVVTSMVLGSVSAFLTQWVWMGPETLHFQQVPW